MRSSISWWSDRRKPRFLTEGNKGNEGFERRRRRGRRGQWRKFFERRLMEKAEVEKHGVGGDEDPTHEPRQSAEQRHENEVHDRGAEEHEHSRLEHRRHRERL